MLKVLTVLAVLASSVSSQVIPDPPLPEGTPIGTSYGYSSVILPWRNPCGPETPWIKISAVTGEHFLVRPERFPETRNWRWSYKVSVRLPDGLSCFPIGRVIFFVHTGFHPAERLLDWSTTNSLYSALFIVPVHKVVMEPSETESQVYEVEFPVPALVIRQFSVHHQVAGVVFDYSGPVAVITSNAVRVDIPASDIPR